MSELRTREARPIAVAACLVLVVLLITRKGSAESSIPSNVELRYAAPRDIPGCLSESEFEEAVRARLAGGSFSGHEAISVTTTIERHGERLRATVTLREGGGAGPATEAKQEIFAGPNECATLSAAAALAASLTIQRSRAHAESTPPAPEVTSPPEAAVPARARPAERAPRRERAATPVVPDRADRPQLRTHVIVAGGHGLLPSSSVGTTFGASVKVDRRWSAGLEAGGWLPASATSPSGPGGGKAWLVFSSASACAHPGHWFVCGVGTIGTFRASGTGRLRSRSGDSTYVALGARVGTEIVLAPPFSLVIHATALAPLLRPSLRIGDELLWRAPLVGAELGIGIRVSIL